MSGEREEVKADMQRLLMWVFPIVALLATALFSACSRKATAPPSGTTDAAATPIAPDYGVSEGRQVHADLSGSTGAPAAADPAAPERPMAPVPAADSSGSTAAAPAVPSSGLAAAGSAPTTPGTAMVATAAPGPAFPATAPAPAAIPGPAVDPGLLPTLAVWTPVAVDASAADGFITAARRLQDGHRYDEALRAYRQAMAADPNRASPHSASAYIYLKLGRHQDAYLETLEALAREPDMPTHWMRLGDVYAAMDDAERALAAYERALSFTPSSSPVLLRKGDLLWKVGREQEARSAWQAACDGGTQAACRRVAEGLSTLARKFDDVFLMLSVGGSRRDLAVGTGAC